MYYADRPEKRGWIAHGDGGGDSEDVPQSITFEVPLPDLSKHPELPHGRFSVLVGYLRSYEGMVRFSVSTTANGNAPSSIDLDGLWDRPRSTSEEAEVLADATDFVNVIATTKPDAKRDGNKVKLLCIRAVGI